MVKGDIQLRMGGLRIHRSRYQVIIRTWSEVFWWQRVEQYILRAYIQLSELRCRFRPQKISKRPPTSNDDHNNCLRVAQTGTHHLKQNLDARGYIRASYSQSAGSSTYAPVWVQIWQWKAHFTCGCSSSQLLLSPPLPLYPSNSYLSHEKYTHISTLLIQKSWTVQLVESRALISLAMSSRDQMEVYTESFWESC